MAKIFTLISPEDRLLQDMDDLAARDPEPTIAELEELALDMGAISVAERLLEDRE